VIGATQLAGTLAVSPRRIVADGRYIERRVEQHRDIHHVLRPPGIQHFFRVYKAHQPGAPVSGDCWAGRAAASAKSRRACGNLPKGASE
jgi:hypothetical protein